jgi:hypothetical protein
MKAADPEVGNLEGVGAANLDDIPIAEEGEALDPRSIIALPSQGGLPSLRGYKSVVDDPLLQQIKASEKKWVVIADALGAPRAVLNAHHFLRAALFNKDPPAPEQDMHRPILTEDPRTPLGKLTAQLKVPPRGEADDVVDEDVILLWGGQKRILTGADILGRLLRGIARRDVRH